MVELAVMLGLEEVNSLFSGNSTQAVANANKVAAKLRGKTQEEIDQIYDQIARLPNGNQYLGSIRSKVNQAAKDKKTLLKAAQLKQRTEEAQIEEAVSKANRYNSKSALGKVLDFGSSKRDAQSELNKLAALDNMSAKDYVNKLENQA